MKGSSKRLVSGMRPTGKLHLGHALGALDNWLKLQDQYESFFIIVDWHALTTHYKNVKELQRNIREVFLDYLAYGIDPSKSVIYLQSLVPEVAELHLLMSMIVPVARLERVPSYKDQIAQLGKDIATYGFLGYPLLMTCDIIAFKGEVVPVGQDQIPHLELAREIVRKFHSLYNVEIFPEPQPLLTKAPYVPGWDGRKMSKSYDNAIYLTDEPEVIQEKVRRYITDPQKIRKGDPGRPEVCNVFKLHQAMENPALEEIERDCRSGKLGCVQCKRNLAELISKRFEGFRERRKELESRAEESLEILVEGSKRARKIASETLEEVKEAMNIAFKPSA